MKNKELKIKMDVLIALRDYKDKTQVLKEFG